MQSPTRWNFTVRLPRDVQRKLKVYGADKGLDLQQIGEEMVALWAKEKGVALPSLGEDKSDGVSDHSGVVVR
jgi:hypothetical protein